MNAWRRHLLLAAGPMGSEISIRSAGGGAGGAGPTGPTGPTGPSGSTLFANVTTSGNQSTITVGSITAGNALRIMLMGRTSSGSQNANWILFNGDTTAGNYDMNQQLQGSVTTANVSVESAAATGLTAGVFPGVGTDAQAVGTAEIIIVGHSDTVFQKTFLAKSGAIGGTGQNNVRIQSGRWKNTAAITAFTLTAGAGTFVNGTRCLVWID